MNDRDEEGRKDGREGKNFFFIKNPRGNLCFLLIGLVNYDYSTLPLSV